VRVWSYQFNLQRQYGINEDAKKLVSSMKYLPDFCYFTYEHISKKVRKEKENKELNEYAIEVAASMVEHLAKVNTLDQFEKRWFTRLEKLKNK
jgi:hypothetical protein